MLATSIATVLMSLPSRIGALDDGVAMPLLVLGAFVDMDGDAEASVPELNGKVSSVGNAEGE